MGKRIDPSNCFPINSDSHVVGIGLTLSLFQPCSQVFPSVPHVKPSFCSIPNSFIYFVHRGTCTPDWGVTWGAKVRKRSRNLSKCQFRIFYLLPSPIPLSQDFIRLRNFGAQFWAFFFACLEKILAVHKQIVAKPATGPSKLGSLERRCISIFFRAGNWLSPLLSQVPLLSIDRREKRSKRNPEPMVWRKRQYFSAAPVMREGGREMGFPKREILRQYFEVPDRWRKGIIICWSRMPLVALRLRIAMWLKLLERVVST